MKAWVEAATDFSVNLYRQLAIENRDANMFFSPYSLYCALMMAAEGARAETALEFGEVLKAPSALRSNGDANRLLDLSSVRTGLVALNAGLQRGDAEAAAVRGKIRDLEAALKSAREQAKRIMDEGAWDESDANREAVRAPAHIEAELTRLSRRLAPEFRVANALWCERAYPLDDAFVNTLEEHYGVAGAFTVDFQTDPASAAARINDWVLEQTNGRIRDLVSPDALDALTRLILANAIYFKGRWLVPFAPSKTEPRDFKLKDETRTKVPMMHAPDHGGARYAAFHADGSPFSTPHHMPQDSGVPLYPDRNGFLLLELPYVGGRISMLLVAPNRPAGLVAIEEKLTPGALETWISSLETRDVHVFVPKFTLETTLEVSETLKQLGLGRAFTPPDRPGGAQFGGMTTSTVLEQQLWIARVLHKALVEVTEEGTEAAAVSAMFAVALGVSEGPTPVPFVPTFRADRPFIFIIREMETGCLLFMGRMTQPASHGDRPPPGTARRTRAPASKGEHG